MSSYQATTWRPPLVQQALHLAKTLEFSASCSPEVGRLLYVLTAQLHHGCIAEIGSGCGVGAAWIVSALAPTATFVTIEADRQRAVATQDLFTPYPNVRVLHGDWPAILDYAPFALLFADGGKAKEREPERLLDALQAGGILILDDLTPEAHWTPEQRAMWSPDPTRSFWLNDERVAATELLVNPTSAVILATRLTDGANRADG